MKKIHVLPTDKPSRLIQAKNDILILLIELAENNEFNLNKHIYITSDEKIKEKDWFFRKSCAFGQHNGAEILLSKDDRKIILTTDQDLIKDGVQAIDDEFLEWFVKNPSCEYVEVVKLYLSNKGIWKEVLLPSEWEIDTKVKYMTIFGTPQEMYDENEDFKKSCEKIIIPKEEPKQDLVIDDFEIELHLTKSEERGKAIVDYLKKYEGQPIYNDIAIAIQFGYQLKLKEDKEVDFMSKELDIEKERSLKQETLEEVSLRLAQMLGTKDSFKYIKSAFEIGAKWQQEQDKNKYSELAKLRNELYEQLPTGKLNAFDLIKIINNHINRIDELI